MTEIEGPRERPLVVPAGRRVAVIASASGNGKTTLGRELARRVGVPFVELDALVHGPGWVETPDEALREQVGPIVTGDGWVVDGTYWSKLGRLVLDAADVVVWLDLPARVWLPRLAVRTWRRVRGREDLWNGNRETLRSALWGRDSLFVWAVRHQGRRRREWPAKLAGLPVVRLRTPAEVERLLEQVGGFDYQPTLLGELLELRPLRAGDFAGLYAAASDPAVWEQHPERDRYREEVFRPYFETLLASREALAAIDRATGEVVGTSRFHGFGAAAGEVEIGWTFLARSHWGGACNAELKRLMLGHAFRFARSVVFVVGPGNLRSRRAVEKIGGVPAGTRVDAAGRESVVYRIDAP